MDINQVKRKLGKMIKETSETSTLPLHGRIFLSSTEIIYENVNVQKENGSWVKRESKF